MAYSLADRSASRRAKTTSPEPAREHCPDRVAGRSNLVAAQPSSAAGGVSGLADQAVSRSSKASGVMSMWNSIPSALASLDNVASDGS
jgi:hypothetical protein